MTSNDPRTDSTRRWSWLKVYLTIGGFLLVLLIASSAFWLPVLVGADETPAVENTTIVP